MTSHPPLTERPTDRSTDRAVERSTDRSADRVEATRRRVHEATRESVLQLGVARTSMVEIAKRSGVGRTTLYRYWPDLTTLMGEVLTSELLSVVRAAAAETHDGDDVARLVCDTADELRRSPLLHALREHEPELVSTYIFRRLGTAQRYLVKHLARRLAAAAENDPRLAGRDPETVATMTLLTVQGAVHSAGIAAPPLDPDTWNAELRVLVSGYFGL